MKKILFTAAVDGHIVSFHIPYLKMFKEQGYEVHVATNGKKEIPYCDVKHTISFERSPINVKNLKAIKELKKIIDKENFDIIHCHTPTASVLTRLAARKIRKAGTKVIYTAHGFHFYKGAPKLNWIMYYPLEKIMAHYTDCLITITQEDFECAKRHLKCKNIEHINGVGLNTYRLKKEISEEEKITKRNELGLTKDDIIFSYVAELNKNKNQVMLIGLMKKLINKYKNLKLLLIGQGNLIENYKSIVEKNNLEKNIKILGKRSDINELLSITDIYLASSKREGLPVNVMEAMYKRLPIIATNNRGHKELISKDTGYIVNNVKELEEKATILIEKPELRKQLGNNARKNTEKYEINNVLEEMKKIYLKQI